MARIDAVLRLAKERGASDLHLSAGALPMVRIHGEITPLPYEQLTSEVCEQLLFEIMDSRSRARYDQVHDVDFSYEIPEVMRVRCNVYEQDKGVSGAFRLLPGAVATFEELGLPPGLARLTEVPRGLVIVTGPPGTGKSSTLASTTSTVTSANTSSPSKTRSSIATTITNRW
jgi:twitching motility protein PilT